MDTTHASEPGSLSAAAGARAHTRAPLVRLALGLFLSLLTIVAFSLYAAHEIARLRQEQIALSERNRRDSLQLIRIQSNLSSLAVTLRDMMERAEPYPMAAWSGTFQRLRLDLAQAFELERTLAPARPPEQQQQITETTARFWEAVDRALALAARGDEPAAIEIVRVTALPRHAELTSLVTQLLILNTSVEETSAAAAREVYTRVIREIYWLMAIIATAVAVAGVLNIVATRRAFEEVRTLSAQLRALTWRMLRLQEDVQTSTARELHDEFGQILTAIAMLLSRVKRNVENTALVKDVEEVHTIARETLERIRTQSRVLHPVILDDFGVDQALAWYVDQFSRQHGVETTFAAAGFGAAVGPAGGITPEVAIHVYRIAQEALTNVSRHAGATKAAVRLTHAAGVLTLDVEDNGRGLTAASGGESRPTGIGITSMRERAELVGGQLTLTRAGMGGVLVRCVIPLGGAGERVSW